MIQRNGDLTVFEVQNSAIVFNQRTKKSCRLGPGEYRFFLAMDGRKSMEELAEETDYDAADARELIRLFDGYGLLESSRKDADKKAAKKHVLLKNVSFPEAFSKPVCKHIFDFLMIISLPALVFAILYMRGKIDTEGMIRSAGIIHLIVMDLILAVSVSLHEIFHAVSARNNGAFCAEIGYKFDFIFPSAYTTICGISEIKKRSGRIQVFWAGMGINALIAAGSLLLMNIPPLRNNLYIFLVFSCNLCLILINCITAFRTDGYQLLCQLIGNTRLREDTLLMLKGLKPAEAGKIIYFMLTYIAEPAAVILLIITAIGKIGGRWL